jgi:ankyrin repeat protein
MQENLCGEITPAKFNDNIIDSTKFINALLKISDKKESEEGEQIFALNIIPKIINELTEKNNISIMKKLKNFIININFTEYTKRNPLHIAAWMGNLPMLKFLLKLRLGVNDVDESKSTPLNFACLLGNREVALMLKEKGGILNMTPHICDKLLEYAYKGDLERLDLFYECGANLNIEDFDKRTLGHIAAAEGHIHIIKFLVEKTNFNIMVCDRWGNTPYSDAKDDYIKEIIKKKYKNGIFFVSYI